MNLLTNQSKIDELLKMYLIISKKFAMPKYLNKVINKFEVIEMTEEEAEKDFINMYNIFIKFINDKDKFNIENIDEIHLDSLSTITSINNGEMDNSLIADYYFEDNSKKYSLDITRDIAEFGYNEDYKQYNEDTIFCKIVEYREFYEVSTIKYEMDFAFDIKNQSLVEIIAIERNAIKPNNQKVNIRLEDEYKLEKVMKRNSI